MLHVLPFLAMAAVQPIVSTEWLQAHLSDPHVRVIYVGERADYELAHIPHARQMDHMDTVEMAGGRHRLAPADALVRAFTKAGIADDAHVILYGDTPMATGWVYTALASIGHGDDVSWLDGGLALWQAEKRPIETDAPPVGTGPLTARATPSPIVDAAWVREHLQSQEVKILDVRTDREWSGGHLPNATLILWEDLYADRQLQKFKSAGEIRALLTKAGVEPNQEVVTYCAIGMRASLMAWAARSVGVPARVYLGSWRDWSANASNPIVR